MDIEYYINKVRDKLNNKRFNHSMRVAHEAVKLAKSHEENPLKAEIAGILHDYAKNLSKEELGDYIKQCDINVDDVMLRIPELAHGIVGAHIVKDRLYIEDEDLLNSIRYHTTGRTNMSKLEKIIYIADYIEPMRNFAGVDEVRDMAYIDLDRALLMALDNTIKFLIDRKAVIHPLSLKARNDYLQQLQL